MMKFLEKWILVIIGVGAAVLVLVAWIGFHFLTWIECRELHSFLSCLMVIK